MLGQRIRRLYVDQLGFLPQKLEDENTIYMRSIVPCVETKGRTSHIQRTIESLTQVFTGLYPKDKATAVPNFHLRLVHQENLYPNDDFCAFSLFGLLTNYSRLKRLSEDYSVKAAKEWDPKLKISSQVLVSSTQSIPLCTISSN
jgi:acid phosphatase